MNPDRLRLSSIPSLTFRAGEHTTGRRTDPTAQLVCDGAPCAHVAPSVVHCSNAGGFGTEVQWTCTAELPEPFRLGRVEVGCEGWDMPGDQRYVKLFERGILLTSTDVSLWARAR
jgi:hypothetical protein